MRIGSILTLHSLSYLVDIGIVEFNIRLYSPVPILSFLCQLDMTRK